MDLLFLKDEFDKVSPLINERIIEEVNRNLINPYFARDDYWWMGFSGQQVNNWNPWINYNVLQALMLIEKRPGTCAARSLEADEIH